MDGSLVGYNFAMIREQDLPAYLVQRVARLRAKLSLNQSYLYATISSGIFTQYVQCVKTVTAIPHISANDIRNFKIWLPCLEEQEKIADFLTAINQKIEAVAKQIELTEQFKKGLLQKMFV